MSNKYIFNLDNKPKTFDISLLEEITKKHPSTLNDKEIEYLLDWVIYRVQQFLPSDSSYDLMCVYASDLASNLLRSLGLYPYKINISSLMQERGNIHTITMVSFSYKEHKTYILDPTYRQFLVKSRCDDEHPNNDLWQGHCPGYFLAKSEEGIDFGTKLLNKGYFKLTEENLKIYIDAFIRYRNDVRKLNKKDPSKTGEQYLKDLLNIEESEINNIDNGIKDTPIILSRKYKKLFNPFN